MIQLGKFSTVQLTKRILTISFCLFQSAATQGLFAQSAVNNSVDVQALNTEAEAASLYTLNFTLPDTLQPDAVLEVIFPNGFDLSRVNLAGSATINGGFKVSVEGQTIKVSRKGKGVLKYPGDKVDVIFSIVKNPAAAESSHLIKLKIDQKRKNVSSKELLGTLLISGKKSVTER